MSRPHLVTEHWCCVDEAPVGDRNWCYDCDLCRVKLRVDIANEHWPPGKAAAILHVLDRWEHDPVLRTSLRGSVWWRQGIGMPLELVETDHP